MENPINTILVNLKSTSGNVKNILKIVSQLKKADRPIIVKSNIIGTIGKIE